MSSHHLTHSRSQKLAGASRSAVLLRLFMFLAAWHGPVPWCHYHGTLDRADLAKAPSWLAEHLLAHHAAVSAVSGIFFGWHMHAVLPASSTDDPQQSEKAEQYRLPTSDTAGSVAGQLSRTGEGLSHSLAAQIERHHGGLPGRDASGSQVVAHFFDRFAPALSLPLRFGVSRC